MTGPAVGAHSEIYCLRCDAFTVHMWTGEHWRCDVAGCGAVDVEEERAEGEAERPKSASASSVRWELQQLADVVPRQVRWLVPGLIPLRALTLVAGVGGLGKSTWLLARAAELSRAGIDVIVVSFEDTAAEIIRPRVQAAGGDLSRVHVMVLADAGGLDTVQLPRDLDDLRKLVRSVNARLVIIDPVVAAFEMGFDTHKDQHVRTVLAQLARLAEDEDAAVALVGHLNKAPSTEAYIRVANSVAFWNACRSVVLITEDGDNEDSRLIAQRKANWARLRPVERHRVEEIVLPDTVDPETGESIVTSRLVFVAVADDVDGADVLAGATKTATAETLLEALLADGDWQESEGVKRLMDAAGFSERTVQRAAQYIGVESERRGFPAVTWWRISLGGATAASLAPQTVAPSEPPQSGATVDVGQPSGFETTPVPVAPRAPREQRPRLEEQERADRLAGDRAIANRELPAREQAILDDLVELLDAREVEP